MNETTQAWLALRGIAGMVFLLLASLLGGTFRTDLDITPDAANSQSAGVDFTETLHAQHWLAGLVRGKQPAVEEALAKYVRRGERLSHLNVATRYSGTDILVTGLTLGIYCPQTVIVRGTMTREMRTASAL